VTAVIHHYSENYSFEDTDLAQRAARQMPARQPRLPGPIAATGPLTGPHRAWKCNQRTLNAGPAPFQTPRARISAHEVRN